MTNEVAKANPYSSEEIFKRFQDMGMILAQSGMIGCATPQQGTLVAMFCETEGLTHFGFARTYDVIDNKISMKSAAMVAKFRALGGKFEILEFSNTRAAAKYNYKDQKDVILEYTIEDARIAGLIKPGSGYEKRPKNMLWARLQSNSIRMIAPEVNAGIYTPEETKEFSGPDNAKQAIVTEVDASEVMNAQPTVDSNAVGAGSEKPASTETKPANKETVIVEAGIVEDKPATETKTCFDAADDQKQVQQAEQQQGIDYSICPQLTNKEGKPVRFSGMKWATIPTAQLQKALMIPDNKISPQHKEAINNVIKTRGEA